MLCINLYTSNLHEFREIHKYPYKINNTIQYTSSVEPGFLKFTQMLIERLAFDMPDLFKK